MNYQIEMLPSFEKAVKRLVKKYRRIKKDLLVVIDNLSVDPFIGFAIPGFDRQVWKIRAASSDISGGKRGGYRVIYAINESVNECYLLYIYLKSQKSDISASELESLLVELENYLFDDE